MVSADAAGPLERELEQLCRDTGFPDGEEFKWSPGAGLWMRGNLVHPEREQFFLTCLSLAARYEPTVIVVLEDTNYKRATDAATSEMDVTALLLERINNAAQASGEDVVVVADRPGGGRGDEDDFLSAALTTRFEGTEFVQFDRIPINVLTTSSRHVRCLQLADVVTSCTTAHICGEATYSPPIFEALLPFVYRMFDCYGGRGIKIHPDYRYANLYHWLLGDTHAVRYPMGIPYPLRSRAYADGPDSP